jgi:hypothetical protein
MFLFFFILAHRARIRMNEIEALLRLLPQIESNHYTYEESVALCHVATRVVQAALEKREEARPCAGTYWRLTAAVHSAITAYNTQERKRQKVSLDGTCPIEQSKRKFSKNYKGPAPSHGNLCDACGATFARDVKKKFCTK